MRGSSWKVIIGCCAIPLIMLGSSAEAQVAPGRPADGLKGTVRGVPSSRLAQAEPKIEELAGPGFISLSLKEALQLALMNNLDIAIEGFNPQIREAEVVREQATFDPSTFAEVNGGKSVSSNVTFSILSKPDTRQDQWNANVGVKQLLPTGTSYEVRVNDNRTNLNPPPVVFSFDPATQSTVGLTLDQPLLKNFGIDVNRTRINLARNNLGISQEQLRARANDVITSAQVAYWDLVAAIDRLKVQRHSYKVAQELVNLNKARVKAGVAAPVEVTSAEAEVAARLQDVIAAQKGVKDAEDRLKLILNPAGGDRVWDLGISPTDKPPFEIAEVSLVENIREALERRPERKQAELNVANTDLNFRLAKNQLLPKLNFQGGVGLDLLEHQYESPGYNYVAGLVFEVPIGNRAARAELLRAKLGADQARVALQNLDRTITSEVREAVRRIQAAAEVVIASGAGRRLAEEELRVEQKRLEAGVTTTFNVLRIQRDLVEAQAREIAAITDYNKALANLERVKGTILEKYGLQL
ncbi:MAG: TolC family protein [candidate division NC10 bacterium]|nr:TolC family protein [candidate division NC10 bacterium]